jgi:putative heme iron utilization protein
MSQLDRAILERTLAAKALLRRARFGVLSTHSQKQPHFPYGSVLPCAVTVACQPILCISTLAAHSQNIQIDPQVAFTVADPNSVPETLAGGRFCYMGVAELVAEADRVAVRQRFLSLVPSAQLYVDFGDFQFYTLRFERGHYIGGFGGGAWLEPDGFATADPVADWAIAHLSDLNRECGPALQAFASARGEPETLLASLDQQGFDVQLGERVLRLEFPSPLSELKLETLIPPMLECLTQVANQA